MVSSDDVRVVLHVRGSVFTVCVLLRLLLSVPVHASFNRTLMAEAGHHRRDLSDIASSFLLRGGWDYGSVHGPAHWPGFCTTGRRQSPVDLVEDDAESGAAERFAFFNYDSPAPLKLVNNGHSVSASVTENCPRAVGAGKLPGLYYLDSFHFHWKSEHTINGKQFPLELHLVHVKDKYKSINEARADPEGLAVIGVLFKVGGPDNKALTPLVEAVKKVSDAVESTADVADFKLTSLLPDIKHFFRFDGSLTTPNCDEIVVWTVIKETVPISFSQLKAFHQVRDDHKEVLHKNFRPVQPINDRTIILVRSGTSRTLTRGISASLLVALSLYV